MADALRISVGQHSDKGRKEVNQDFYGVSVPKEPLLSSKGIAVALADGIGSSEVSQIASEFAVMSFLDDYYCTSEAWSVRRSVQTTVQVAVEDSPATAAAASIGSTPGCGVIRNAARMSESSGS